MRIETEEFSPRTPWWRVRVSPGRQVLGVVSLLIAASFFYAMFGLGLRFFAVTSISMEPTLHEGDRVAAFPVDQYERGDLVVLVDPVDKRGHIVKRVVGLPGDTIEIYGGALILNGTYVSEPYRPEAIDYLLPAYTVPDSAIFVLGDNANWSVDSHDWAAYEKSDRTAPGAVPMKQVVGRVWYRYLPFGKIGPIRPYPIKLLVAS